MSGQLKKFSMLFVLAALGSLPTFGNDTDKKEDNQQQIETLDPFYHSDNPSEPQILEFYDLKDELVYKVTITKDDEPNADLAKYLNESDFLVQNLKTSYFRLNN
ncbi:hypothetical protein [Fulvivirga lutimaris]|uniref:hypothetical protein n=1 Tax=Fulvivirga lutimaris TaxID=1819566 RepID=UPI0012BC2B74|nr:hypothetical protein [Fulvivirga lutimaris]MTI39169.1 hypothetical protein [Fulvivirga lutimaris]